MNETSQSQQEEQIVDLGEAKKVTTGFPIPGRREDNPVLLGDFE